MSPKLVVILATVGVLAAGSTTGYLLAQKYSPAVFGSSVGPKEIRTDREVGSTDTQTFRDSARGTLEKDGINGEGTHRLVREGGPSQTVYLVSSIVDLDEFVGKKVEVWGETVKGQKAAWLMDVGRVKILE